MDLPVERQLDQVECQGPLCLLFSRKRYTAALRFLLIFLCYNCFTSGSKAHTYVRCIQCIDMKYIYIFFQGHLRNMGKAGYPEDTIIHQNTTSSTVSDTYTEDAKRFLFYGDAVVQPVIFLLGLVTNIISLIVLPRVKMAETFKACLIALAISDLCACLTGASQRISKGPIFRGETPFGYHSSASIANFALYFAYLMFMSTSGGIVVMIAIIRNINVMKPLKARRWFTRRNTVRICSIVFLVNFIAYLPSAVDVTWMTCYKDVAPFCLRVNKTIGFSTLERIVNVHLCFIGVSSGPITFVVYIACVISIWVTLKRSTKGLVTMAPTRADRIDWSASKRNKTTGKITRVLVIILVLDMVCTLPIMAYAITVATKPKGALFEDGEIELQVFDVAAEIFYCFRPAYNFWVYFFNNPDFRRGLRKAPSSSDMFWGYTIDINSAVPNRRGSRDTARSARESSHTEIE